MTNGLSGRIVTYDAENRPLSVTLAGKTTCYVYGAGGARLKKIENLAAGTDCKAISPTAPVTLYFGAVEVRNFRLAGLEQILTYPQPSVKLLNGVLPANASYLHRDAQGAVRLITNATGVSDQRRFYLPYGAVSLSTVAVTNPAPDTKGWIGERFDADAGLQYRCARYYDPQLGMFLQPDWWEVMQAGVGTNRYSYSFGDPVNGIDPSGHDTVIIGVNAEFTPVIGVAGGFGIRIDIPTEGQGRFDIILMGNVSGRAGLSAGVDSSWDWTSTSLAPMKLKTSGDIAIEGSVCILLVCQGVSKSLKKTVSSRPGKVETNSEVSISVPKVKVPVLAVKAGVSVGLTAKGEVSLRNTLSDTANAVSKFFKKLFGA